MKLLYNFLYSFLLYIALALTFSNLLKAELLETSQHIIPNENGAVIIFDSENCFYCKKLHDDLKNDPKLSKTAKDFRIYSIQEQNTKPYFFGKGGQQTRSIDLARAYEVRGTPTIVVFDTDYNLMIKIPGYIQPDIINTILELTKQVSSKKITRQDFSDYLNKLNKH
jgi:thioredoxin-related protein